MQFSFIKFSRIILESNECTPNRKYASINTLLPTLLGLLPAHLLAIRLHLILSWLLTFLTTFLSMSSCHSFASSFTCLVPYFLHHILLVFYPFYPSSSSSSSSNSSSNSTSTLSYAPSSFLSSTPISLTPWSFFLCHFNTLLQFTTLYSSFLFSFSLPTSSYTHIPRTTHIFFPHFSRVVCANFFMFSCVLRAQQKQQQQPTKQKQNSTMTTLIVKMCSWIAARTAAATTTTSRTMATTMRRKVKCLAKAIIMQMY